MTISNRPTRHIARLAATALIGVGALGLTGAAAGAATISPTSVRTVTAVNTASTNLTFHLPSMRTYCPTDEDGDYVPATIIFHDSPYMADGSLDCATGDFTLA